MLFERTVDTRSTCSVDDSTKLLFDEYGPGRPAARERPLQVHILNLVPFLIRHVLEAV